MNSFVVIFAALIIAVSGSSLRNKRQSGGWGAPPAPLPQIEIDLTASGAASGSGAADSTLGVLAVAVGGPLQAAEVDVSAQTTSLVAQDIDLLQVAAVTLDPAGPSSSSLNNIVVDNIAASDEGVSAYVAGQESAYLASNAADSASGQGQISASATSLNSQIGG